MFFLHYYICVGVYIAFSLLKQYNIKLIIINCNYYILSINFMLLVYNSNSNNNLLCLLSLCAKSIVFCNTVSIHLVRIVFFFFVLLILCFFYFLFTIYLHILICIFVYVCVLTHATHPLRSTVIYSNFFLFFLFAVN